MQPPPGFRPRKPWQPAAIEWACSRQQVPLYLDKRLGKCTCILEWAVRTGGGQGLIVTQPSAMPDWLREIESDGLTGALLIGSRDEREAIMARNLAEGTMCFVTNPQGLFLAAGRKVPCVNCEGRGEIETSSRLVTCGRCNGAGNVRAEVEEPTALATYNWDWIVWDEPTVGLANPKAQSNHIAFRYMANCPRKALLSGEPAPEGPHQLFEQMRWLFGSFMGHRNFWKWREENFKQVGYEWYPLPGRLQAIMEAKNARSYTMSRKDAGMPNHRTFERRYVVLPQKIREAYDVCEKHMEIPSSDNGTVVLATTKYKVVSTNWLSQLAGGYPKDFPALDSHHKTDLVYELLTTIFKNEQTIILCRFNKEVLKVHNRLAAGGLQSGIIWGETPILDRKRKQDLFNKGLIQHIVAQIKCMRHGSDWSASSTMLRYSLSDSWEDISQSMDRIVSPNKTDVLAYVDILADDTVDVDRVDALEDKKIGSRAFMETFGRKFRERKARKEASQQTKDHISNTLRKAVLDARS